MKLDKLLLIVLLLIILGPCTYAQKVTDDELKRYVVALDSIETLKDELTVTMNKISKGNDKISAQRYTALIQITNDEAKLAEVKATSDEIAYIKQATLIQKEETLKFQKAYQSLISDYVGDSVFGKVRNALKADTVLKKKYDSLMTKFK